MFVFVSYSLCGAKHEVASRVNKDKRYIKAHI